MHVEMLRIVVLYVQALAWPTCVLVLMLAYKEVIARLIPGAKIKFSIAQFSVETSIPEIEQSVRESLVGGKLTDEEISLLKNLRDQGRTELGPSLTPATARPLRDAGLLTYFPRGVGRMLANAKEIEITTLGRLVVEAAEKRG